VDHDLSPFVARLQRAEVVMSNNATNPGSQQEEDDRAVTSEPVPTDDGGEVELHQQNAGPGNQVGAGEFKTSEDTSFHKTGDQAAAEEAQLEEEAPTGAGPTRTSPA
jgi:hypothetical protein